MFCFFFSSRRRHTRCGRDWSSDVCSSDLRSENYFVPPHAARNRSRRRMTQVIQNYRTGLLEVVEVPPPRLRPGTMLVQNLCSAVSSGTERMVTELARKNLLAKALARPDLVRRVFDKVRADGAVEAFQQVAHRLDTPVPLGYSSAGEVIAVGAGVSQFRVGEIVACGGQGVATHSEIVCVPKTLAARVPPGLEPAEAAFAMVGAVALHAVRLARVGQGDFVAVVRLRLPRSFGGSVPQGFGLPRDWLGGFA